MHMYPGTQHGFNNDTTPRYDEAAAKLAWQRTIEFFNKHLREMRETRPEGASVNRRVDRVRLGRSGRRVCRPRAGPPAQHSRRRLHSLFNGKDLSGWVGRQGTYSPYEQAKLTPEQLAAKKAEWNADRDKHWRVDTAKGEIVSDGQGVHLATERTTATSSCTSTG